MIKFTRLQRYAAILTTIILLLLSSPASARVKVEVLAIDPALAENIEIHIGSVSQESLDQRQTLDNQLKKAVEKGAFALGYYHASYSYRVMKKKLRITIDSGPRAQFIDPIVEVYGEAALLPEFIALQQTALTVDRQPLDHGRYDDFKQTLRTLTNEYGFYDAKFTKNELRIDRQNNTGQPVLILHSGERYHFGEVSFEGSSVEESILRFLIPFEKGGLVDRDTFLDLNRNLLDTEYFNEVNIQRQINKDTKTLDLLVLLDDSDKNRFEVGAGYSTDYGPRVRFGWNKSLFNSKGHSADFSTELSQPKQEMEANYRIPWDDPLRKFVNISSGYQLKDVEDSATDLFTSSVAYIRHYDSDWVLNYSLTGDIETYSQGGGPATTAQYILPGFGVSKSYLSEVRDPSRGHRFETYVRGSTESLGADVAFLKSYVSYRYLTPIFSRKTLLLLRGELGAIETDDILQVPVSRRFFAGGDNSIRGYNFESVSSTDSDGILTGGAYLNTFSIELSYLLFENWRVAAFADTGRAYNDSDEPFSTGVGGGIRWLSPIGQIRFDLAIPLSDEVDQNYMIHISMGPPL
ncbi:autotransporter assembly complex protein TamA [Sinobacterium norvegicum]|uniref:autotransporter assembly complex protein TamA n=1 Tax=Sinobacterium norvegicum TaxID=1641715 RepID=UPI001F195CE4|nr:autotransporter assembly complex family protein [Sinobacterium norvegicum]